MTMARMIRHEATGPYRIDPQDKPAFICRCGLTQSLPHCDGSHSACGAEEPGKLYIYDASRRKVVQITEDGA
jgi:CDGSH-type Zn-finger protein